MVIVGFFQWVCRALACQNGIDQVGQGLPVGGSGREGRASVRGGLVVLACGSCARGHESGTDAALAFQPGQRRVDGAFGDSEESDLAQPLHHLVAVGLAIGKQTKQQQGQDAFQ